jgi:hypothetical protein
MPIELLRDGTSRRYDVTASASHHYGDWGHWRDSVHLWKKQGGGEQELKDCALQALGRLFIPRQECWGTLHDIATGQTKRLRVDMVLEPKFTSRFALGPVAVEFKHPCRGCTRDLGDHIKQAIDYRQTVWDGYGRLPVFLCPGFQHGAGWDGNGEAIDREYYKTIRVLGSLGLGELFINPATIQATMILTADVLIHDGQVTGSGMRRSKRGSGLGSAAA